MIAWLQVAVGVGLLVGAGATLMWQRDVEKREAWVQAELARAEEHREQARVSLLAARAVLQEACADQPEWGRWSM